MKLTGIPITSGIAIGRVMHYVPDESGMSESDGTEAWTEGELARYRKAVQEVEEELKLLVRRTTVEQQTHGDIFYAHMAMLRDNTLNEEITELITSRRVSAAEAVRQVYLRYEKLLNDTEEQVIRERAMDLWDVQLRLLRVLTGGTLHDLSRLPGPVVVVAKDLLPSDTATLDRKNVLAIVTQEGSRTAHSAIIARSYDIPAVLGVAGASSQLKEGETVVVDGRNGLVLTGLSEEEMERYHCLREEIRQEKEQAMGARCLEPVTLDGKRIKIELNMQGLTQEVLDARPCVDGVGLFRTEFLYLSRQELPSEEEQFQTYARTAEAFGGKPVTLRTLDIGGDKQASCLDLPREENPFLGKRGLRLCLSRPEVFMTQLRAALRASVYGNLQLMLPMVSSVEDIRAGRAMLEQAKEELRSRGQSFRENVPLGIMVEVPSIALVADLAAREVDFVSIGTNDLCQYIMAADRRNPTVSDYFRTFHPAVLRLIGHVAEEFHRQGKPVAACGEMAGYPMGALVLAGLGVDTLSMSPSGLADVKRTITRVSMERVSLLVQDLKKRALAVDVEDAIQELLDTVK